MSESSVPKITVNSILQLSVDSFEEKFINNKSETVYTINIRNLYNNKKWSLEKVYHDVEILHQELSKLLPQIPPFSSFSLFKSSRSFNTIVERKEEINEFLNECISRKDILSNKTFYEFIKMDKNFPEYIYNSPELIDIIENDSLCLNDLQYLPDENIIIGLLSNYNITKMVDSFIKNTEVLKWNKEELSAKDLSENDLHNPSANTNSAGAFCVYRVVTFKNKKNLLKVKLEKVFIKYFNDLTGSLFYDKKTNLFLIGFNSGKIIFYKVLPESVFTQFDYMADLKYHSSKISGIALNNMTNNFYTCGNDGKFCQGVVNLIYRENYSPELIHQNSAGYSYMYFDKKNERIYLSTYNGHLEVYLTSTEIASFISDINTSNHKYSLNDLYPYDIKNYLFSCSDLGNISVFDLCKPGQEKTTKELSYFNYYDSKFKIKSVIYDPETNEVITGDNYGRLIFWNLKYGKPIHVTKVNQNGKGICKIRFIDNSEEPNKILLVSCLDNTIYFVKLPLKWVDNEDIEKYEQVEIKVRSDLDAMMKIQDFLAKDEDYNSDEDSLNGWDYFANDAKEEQDKLKNKK
jgi:WD40 repeat protein